MRLFFLREYAHRANSATQLASLSKDSKFQDGQLLTEAIRKVSNAFISLETRRRSTVPASSNLSKLTRAQKPAAPRKLTADKELAGEIMDLVDRLMERARNKSCAELDKRNQTRAKMEFVNNKEFDGLSKVAGDEQVTYKLIELIKLTDKRLAPQQCSRLFEIAQDIQSSELKSAVLAALALSEDVAPINCLHILNAARELDDSDRVMVQACAGYRIDLLPDPELESLVQDILELTIDDFEFFINELIRAENLGVLLALLDPDPGLTAEQSNLLNQKGSAIVGLLKKQASWKSVLLLPRG